MQALYNCDHEVNRHGYIVDHHVGDSHRFSELSSQESSFYLRVWNRFELCLYPPVNRLLGASSGVQCRGMEGS